MHELAICQALVEQVDALARARGGRALRVWLDVGPLAGVEPHLLRLTYPLAAAGSLAEGSDLQLNSVPARVRCRLCVTESTVPPNRLICSSCGNWRTDLIAGDELRLVRIEMREAA